MEQLELVYEDFFYQIFEHNYLGTPVRFTKNKLTGEVKINAHDTARVLGFKNLDDMLGSDTGLDVISDWKKDNPDRPVFGKHGSGAMFEEEQFV